VEGGQEEAYGLVEVFRSCVHQCTTSLWEDPEPPHLLVPALDSLLTGSNRRIIQDIRVDL
jgi:hypothetical protein